MAPFRKGCCGGRGRYDPGGPPSEDYFVFPVSHNIVIPGRREATSPESITTVWGYGFRARDFVAPRNDEEERAVRLLPLRPLVESTQHRQRHRGDAGLDG